MPGARKGDRLGVARYENECAVERGAVKASPEGWEEGYTFVGKDDQENVSEGRYYRWRSVKTTDINYQEGIHWCRPNDTTIVLCVRVLCDMLICYGYKWNTSDD